MKIERLGSGIESAYRIGGTTIPGRFFLAPVNTGFVANGVPQDRLVAFHRARSGPGIAISYVGNVAVHPHLVNSSVTGFLQDRPQWAKVAEAIAEKHSLPGIQLACQMQAEKSSRNWRNGNVEDYLQRESEFIREMSSSIILKLIDHYAEASRLAVDCGFRVIQIHAAHGYLISKLMNPLLNLRSDKFQDGLALLCEIVRAVQAASRDLIVDVRLSVVDGIEEHDMELSRTEKRIEELSNLGVRIISLSNGMYDINRTLIYPSAAAGHGCYIPYGQRFARRFSEVLLNVAGNITDIHKVPVAPWNLSYSIGRPLIADPRFLEKSLNSELGAVNPCKRCGKCHYYSRGREHIECGVNPDL